MMLMISMPHTPMKPDDRKKLDDERLKSEVEKDVERIEKACKEKRTLLAQTVYLGTVGIMLALPIVIGAYLGSWLDERLKGYSVSWTISLILIGVFVGAVNVYMFVKRNE